MLSNPSNAQINSAWEILQHHPELHWSKESLKNTQIFQNEYALAVFSTPVLDEIELLLVATHPDHLRQGHAEILLKKILASLSVKKIFLEVRESNFTARKLYQKLGFIETGKRAKYYPDGEDAILYRYDASFE